MGNSGIGKGGKLWEKAKLWFGFTLHLLVDLTYDLPANFTVTRASMSEVKITPVLIESTKKTHPELIKGTEYLQGDRGYYSSSFICTLLDDYNIKPIINIRNMWKDSDKTKILLEYDNVVYNYRGTVSCYCPITNKKPLMDMVDLRGNVGH